MGMMRLESLGVPQMAAFYYPRMMNLTSESLTQDGVYLLENGHEMEMWIGASVDNNFLQSIFGFASIEQFDPQQAEQLVGTLQNPLSEKVANILREVRSQRSTPWMHLNVYVQKDPREGRFFA